MGNLIIGAVLLILGIVLQVLFLKPVVSPNPFSFGKAFDEMMRNSWIEILTILGLLHLGLWCLDPHGVKGFVFLGIAIIAMGEMTTSLILQIKKHRKTQKVSPASNG